MGGESHHRAGLVFIGVCALIGMALFVLDEGRETIGGWITQRPAAAYGVPAPGSAPARTDNGNYPGNDAPPPIAAEPAAVPTPAPVDGNTGMVEANARAFAMRYFVVGDAGLDEAIPWLGQHYSETVDFFGKATPRASVLQQKIAFIHRWPERSYTIEPATLMVDCMTERGTCSTSGIIDWTAASNERGARTSGRSSFTLVTTAYGDESQIVGEDSHVIARTSGSGQSKS